MQVLYCISYLRILRKIFPLVNITGAIKQQDGFDTGTAVFDMVPLLHFCMLSKTQQLGGRDEAGGSEGRRKKHSLWRLPPCCHWCPHSFDGRLRSERPSCGWCPSLPSVSLHLGQGENMDKIQTSATFAFAIALIVIILRGPSVQQPQWHLSHSQFTHYQLFRIIHIRVVIMVKNIMLGWSSFAFPTEPPLL